MDDFPKPKTVCFVLFDGVQILDVSGPAEVLSQANTVTGEKIYDITYVSSNPTGQVMTSSGIRFVTDPLPQLEQLDVIVLPGGYDILINEETKDQKLMDWLQTTIKKTDLKVSICFGAFILGELGLLSNKKVTTHWLGVSTLKERFSDAEVMNDILHIKDKDVWSSAGILTGIDMMLAMVKEDISNAVALEIARILGIYLFREGNQPQISAAIDFQSKIQDASLLTLISWLEGRLDAQISIEEMANFSAMSVRSLHRKCQTTFNMGPKQMLNELRFDRAKTLLLQPELSIKCVAGQCGFSQTSVFSRAFNQRFGITPSAYRDKFINVPQES